MKNVVLFILVFFCSLSSYAQKKNWFYYLKVGAATNLNTYQSISGTPERLINSPIGFTNLVGIEKSEIEVNDKSDFKPVSFSLTYPVGFYVISPYLLSTGFEYHPISIRNLYRTTSVDDQGYFYILDELNTMQSMAIPVFISSRPLYQKFSGYLGARIHLNTQNWQLQKVSYSETKYLRKTDFRSEEFELFTISYFAGFSFSFLAFEVSYFENTFMNIDYTDVYGRKPYKHLDYSNINFSLSIMMGKLRKSKK